MMKVVLQSERSAAIKYGTREAMVCAYVSLLFGIWAVEVG